MQYNDKELIPEYLIETIEHVQSWIKRDITDMYEELKHLETDQDWENEAETLIYQAHRVINYLERLKKMI